MRKFTIVGLGEVLWDVFPGQMQLGGAPANFAYIASLLGDTAIVASRVGSDPLGDELVTRLTGLGLDTAYLQRDPNHPTGTVKVEVASDGQARFTIVENVAWDHLEWNDSLEALAEKADAVCFGSLAQRKDCSRETVLRFLKATRRECVRIFDVNLRQSFYSSDVLGKSIPMADITKLNHDELPIVVQSLGGRWEDDLRSARWLRKSFHQELVCVTRGSHGSLLVSEDNHHEHPGHAVQVVDTVGAGDAFTATLVHHYLRGSDLSTMNEAANRVGSWVASKPGATPPKDDAVLSAAGAKE